MVTIHWWNHGTKKLDFKGEIKDCLKDRKITFRRLKRKDYPVLERWKFKTCHNVTLIKDGTFDDGAFEILKLYLATMGDKARLDFNGRMFTNNFHR